MEYSHVSVLVLPVGLSVVTDDPVGIGGGGTFCVRADNLSLQRVIESLEKTLTQVHITDRVDGISEDHRAGELAVAIAPVVLDTFQMPLVDEDDDLLALRLVNCLEEFLIALVNEDLLQLGEEDVCRLCVPVNEVLIKALLCESLGVSLMDLLAVGQELLSVEALGVLNAFVEVVRHVHSGLMVDSVNGNTIHLRP